jgi:hypothetical protein
MEKKYTQEGKTTKNVKNRNKIKKKKHRILMNTL